MAKHLGTDEIFIELVKEIFPKIVLYHRYLYEYRDPAKEGLVYIQHNWESGTDNSPLWDEAFEKIDVTHARDVSALRRDIKNVDASQRPTNENYKRYIYLVDLFRECGYDDKLIYVKCPFLIQDVLFNSMLIRSNEGLIELASLIGEDSQEIKTWNERSIASMNKKFWDEESGFYYGFDLKADSLIKIEVSNGLMPLFAGACSPQQALALKNILRKSFKSDDDYLLCPSTAVDEKAFNPLRYWRGPVWINVNWMLYYGLRRYGFEEEAEQIKKDSLLLVETAGFYEYFDPRIGTPDNQRGLGGDNFSWSAALYLDFLLNK